MITYIQLDIYAWINPHPHHMMLAKRENKNGIEENTIDSCMKVNT
jgi:hypothetical protein